MEKLNLIGGCLRGAVACFKSHGVFACAVLVSRMNKAVSLRGRGLAKDSQSGAISAPRYI